jgi:hypothetical protein
LSPTGAMRIFSVRQTSVFRIQADGSSLVKELVDFVSNLAGFELHFSFRPLRLQ